MKKTKQAKVVWEESCDICGKSYKLWATPEQHRIKREANGPYLCSGDCATIYSESKRG